jgi:dephospho-CoA kinase
LCLYVLPLAFSSKHILKIGVTGGIGSGKSAACTIFAHLGVPVLSADDIAKEISTTDATVRKKLIALIGDSAFRPDGSLNRAFIASKMFADKSLQRQMELLLHPRVEKEIERRSKEYRHRGERMVIIEAALIYEAGLNKNLDAVIVVDADESERINRVRQRDAVSDATVQSRIAAQWDVQKKLKKADYVIYNNGTMDELESKVRFLFSVFKQVADGGSGA